MAAFLDDESGPAGATTEDEGSRTLAVTGADTTRSTPPSPPEAASTTLPRDLLAGRYFVVERIAEGGLGVVYKAYDCTLERIVALKVVPISMRLGEARQHAHARLVREAQALAKLDHPNVVPVHDVGTHDGDVFVAMAFVEGSTLGAWLAEAPRSWREIVRVFLAAGAGLVAAHRVGLVHRDFKPANVLVGKDGTVRVVDFGLARAMEGSVPTPDPFDSALQRSSDGASRTSASLALPASVAEQRALDSRPTALTKTGLRMGTPLYMAPEQHAGLAVDERSDQFSFCVALYEAVYGEHPFDTSSYRTLQRAVLRGAVRPEPRGKRVPGWLRAALLRGLAPVREDRHPSLARLLQLLERRSAVGRLHALRALAVAGALVLVAGGVAARRFDTGVRFCEQEARGLESVWTPELEGQVERSFERAAPSFGGRWSAAARDGMRTYVAEWTRVTAGACRDAYVTRAKPVARYEEEHACLARRRAEATELATLFASADVVVAREASDAIAALTPAETCLSPALSHGAPPPLDPGVAREVAELRLELSAIKALTETDQDVLARERATKVVARAEALAHRPLVAEALAALGAASARTGGGPTVASGLLKRSFRTALESRSFFTAAQAAAALTSIDGHTLGRSREGHEWARLVEATLAGDDSAEADEVRTNTAVHETYVYESEEGAQGATEAADRAFALIEKRHGQDGWHRARALMARGVASVTAGVPARAVDEFRQAYLKIEERVGPDHPRAALALVHLAIAEQQAGDLEHAERDYGKAIGALANVYGVSADGVAVALANRGSVRLALHWYDGALEDFERAIATFRRRPGGASEDLANALIGAARSLRGLHLPAMARERIDAAGALLAGTEATPRVKHEHAFVDGLLLDESGGDRKRARQRVEEARSYFASLEVHGASADLLAEIEAWLAAHPPRP